MGDPDDFRAMISFAAAQGIRAPVDRVFALGEAAEALRYLETAHGFGKVIVRIAP
jgi:NADPH:quinone reductase-like Zn-dependent oxidoreductase